MSDMKEIAKILFILGGVLGILFGILTMANMGIRLISLEILGAVGPLIYGIIQVLLGLIVLATSGVIKIPALKFESNWILYLIFGILMVIFGSDLAGILVIIGAILLLIK
ncbi:MAG: hypothetical protein ACFFEF_00635 [Candidatus Thorarchaeota archaeon]